MFHENGKRKLCNGIIRVLHVSSGRGAEMSDERGILTDVRMGYGALSILFVRPNMAFS